MADITLFELHFDGPLSFGPTFGDDPKPDAETTDGDESRSAASSASDADSSAVSIDPESEDADGSGGPPVKGAIVGFLLILGLAVAARVLLGGDDDDVDDVEVVDLDDADVDAETSTD